MASKKSARKQQNDRRENVRIHPGDASRGEVEVLGEEIVWENDTARLCIARVKPPRGEETEQFRLGHAGGKLDGVIVVPILASDRIVLVRQFRHPVRMWIRELPRGGRDDGESPEETARRELHEEVGFTMLESWPLGRVVTDSGQLESVPHIIAARVAPSGDAEPEASEAIDGTFDYSYTELRRACERGEIVDSFTLAAVTRLSPHFVGDRFAFNDRERAMSDKAPPMSDE